jgi:serine/threonine-protein kinase PknK
MVKDLFVTQRDAGDDLVAELEAAGFADAHEVGRGGCGVVYRCSQVQFQRVVAVKLLTEEFADSRARFVREQQAMGRLTGHPNIVAVFEVGQTQSGHPFLVMPYYQCGCIHTRIRRLGLLPEDEVLGLGVKMAGALQSAHELGILHRDVKPANILVTDYGQPALGDFGIARMNDGFHTAAGTFAGSPAFTAPEVLGGDSPSTASDVYSLGATLFAALTGHAAFERRHGEHVMAQFLRIASEPVPDLRERGANDDIADLISAAMAREPGARPSTLELGAALQGLQSRRGWPVDEMAVHDTPPPAPTSPTTTSPTSPTSPASPSVSRAGARLPAPLDSFVGRATEMAEVGALLAESRLVTLTGIGGVGKTTLAIHAARAAVTEFGDGVWFVELADLLDGTLVTDVVAGALGVRDHPGSALIEVLIDFLAERHALVVLDNCEQIINDAAKLAETLLRACPRLHLLATSREVLDIAGEAVLPLPALAAPGAADDPTLRTLAGYAAVALFVDRARAAAPGFALTEHNSVAVARICSCLDGLPLAIEMAAARMRVMSAEQIADGLSDRYGLLSRGRRGAPTRQQTLAACIDWSYDLCTQAEQHLWSRLSVFAGSFDMPAARDICGSQTRTALHNLECTYLLSSLVDKSILIRTEHHGTVRFRLLETVREYGRARLTHTEDYTSLRRRHAAWYQQLATDADAHWFSPQQLQLVQRLTVEMPNIREALHFSLTDSPATAVDMTAALRPFWVFHTMLNEGCQWAGRALATIPAEPSPQRVRALFTAAHLLHTHGDMATAAGWFGEARELLEVIDDPVTRGRIDYLDGYTATFTGDFDRGRDSFQRAMAATDDFEVQAQSRSLGGILELISGDADSALAWAEKGLVLAEARRDWVIRAVALMSAGAACWRTGQLQRAEQLLDRGLRLALEGNATYALPNQLEVLAWVKESSGQPWPAAVLMAAAAELSRTTGAPLVAAFVGGFHTECETRTREQLGTAEFQTASNDGAALTAAQAVAFALTPPTDPSS